MNSITATIEGQTLAVELHRITGRDALDYRIAVGEELDYRVGMLLGIGATGQEMPLADAAVVKWLWTRQNLNAAASLPAVAASVTLFPAPADDSVGAASARPEAD